MLNRYPLWKYLLILGIFVMAVIYSLPNLYAPDPAIQISGASARVNVDKSTVSRVEAAFAKNNIAYFGEMLDTKKNNVLIRLKDKNQQLDAKRVAQGVLGDDYIVALNLAPTTPKWLSDLGADPMKLGLDLSGGVHFLLEVDTSVVIDARLEGIAEEYRQILVKNKIRFNDLDIVDGQFEASFRTQETAERGLKVFRGEFSSLILREEQKDGIWFIRASLSEQEAAKIENQAIEQNLVALKNRVNATGVAEALVQRQGANRIIVELPGVQDTAVTKRMIGRTANLEFRLAANANSSATETFKFRESPNQSNRGSATLERTVIITGDSVSDAAAGMGDGGPRDFAVNIVLNSDAGFKMQKVTSSNVGRGMGVVFIEYNTVTVDKDGKLLDEPRLEINEEIISLANIRGPFGAHFQISGLNSMPEASELALLLKAGALAAPVRFVQENTIGPSLGADNIDKGLESVLLGFGLVLLFMLVFYKLFGLAANIALAVNLVLLASLMSLVGATLTLPGIAGIVLTVGMAVDANVLIFARIKEELAEGLSPQHAINNGFDRAYTTILDANITTLIVAVILFVIGSGPVKGFAVTLSIGILTSVFTAIMVTRAIINLMYGGRKVNKLLI